MYVRMYVYSGIPPTYVGLLETNLSVTVFMISTVVIIVTFILLQAVALQNLNHPYICGYREFFVIWEQEVRNICTPLHNVIMYVVINR